MFDVPGWLLLLLVLPLGGVFAAIYLAVALRNNAQRGEQNQ